MKSVRVVGLSTSDAVPKQEDYTTTQILKFMTFWENGGLEK